MREKVETKDVGSHQKNIKKNKVTNDVHFACNHTKFFSREIVEGGKVG